MADETGTNDTAPVETTEAATVPAAEVAGLKSALEKERAASKEGRAAVKRAADLEAELTKFREASQSDQDKALTQARAEAAKETREGLMQQVRSALVEANVRAAAGGRLADPDDAVRLLDLADFELDERFGLDPAKVTKAVDDLLAAKPYLDARDRADRDGPRRGSFDLGARNGGGTAPVNDPIAADRAQIEADVRAGLRRT